MPDSSTGRALHKHCRGQGSSAVQAFPLLLLKQHNVTAKLINFEIKGARSRNFSIDQVVIELTEIKRLNTIEELKLNTGKLRRVKDGQNWGGLKWIAFG